MSRDGWLPLTKCIFFSFDRRLGMAAMRVCVNIEKAVKIAKAFMNIELVVEFGNR